MKATLFVMPGSHPSMAARLMLEAKGIDYRRIDLIPVISKGVLRGAGFKGTKVPALRLDGERIQGTKAIARALEDAVPEPPLLPADPELRERVEEAETWADEELQEIPRRLIWNVLDRDPRGRRSYLEGAKLGLPVGLATKTAPPLVYLSKRFNNGTDEAVRRDLGELPEIADRVDQLLAEGVIGAAEANVADYQIATCIRLLLTLDDVRPVFEGRDCANFAIRLVPEYSGYAPATLPDDWKPWERSAAAG
ncbi:MAG TPA: glutathione S-transferase family protein [Solirubrobacterales bacterium]|nr:glutathione S-transferase family protein [Solirubrobacterales bacterium]